MSACRQIEIETQFMNEGFNKTPVEPRKPHTKLREAEASRKNITKPKPNPSKKRLRKPKPRPKPTTFECLEAEAGWKPTFSRKARLPEAEVGFQPNPVGTQLRGVLTDLVPCRGHS